MKPSSLIILFVIWISEIPDTCLAQNELIYTPEEVEAIGKFRPLVNNIVSHEYQKIDSYLIRWLRATKLNLNEAVQMLREAEKWRADNNIEIPPVNNTVLSKRSFSHIYSDDGVDKFGRTILTSSLGSVDLRQVFISGQGDLALKAARHYTDKAIARSANAVLQSNGTLKDSRLVILADLNGISLRKHVCLTCLSYYRINTLEIERYFPGAAALAIYINTPRVILPLVDLLLGILSEAARARAKDSIKIFGTDRKEWSKYLLSIIPEDQLSYQFGGTKPPGPKSNTTKHNLIL